MKMIQILFIFVCAITFPHWSCALTHITTSEGGSGEDGVEEVVTLQYCIINNSTILRLDTGEHLDIINTRDNTLVVTSSDFQNFTTVSRLNNELICSVINNSPGNFILPSSLYAFMSVWLAILLLVTGYNITLHLSYKELRNSIGVLLMSYSFFLAAQSISFFMMATLMYKFLISLHYVCYIIKMVYIATDIGYDTTATCILMHTVYHLWQSYKMLPVNPSKEKVLLRRYFGYVTGIVIASMFIILAYDLGVNKQKFDASCDQHDPTFDALVTIMFTISSINRLTQIVLFITYLYYWYKLRTSQVATGYLIDPKLFRIAIAMGVTITFAKFIFMLNWMLVQTTGINFTPLVDSIGSVILLIQYCIIVGLLRWVKNVYTALCKKKVIMEE